MPASEDLSPLPRHLGIVRFSRELLAELLGLPVGCRIDAITSETYFATDEIGIRVEHPSIPETRGGCYLPEIQARIASGPDAAAPAGVVEELADEPKRVNFREFL